MGEMGSEGKSRRFVEETNDFDSRLRGREEMGVGSAGGGGENHA